ncbi:FAD-dependent oxidoreductase [Frigoribacterium sp. VKM Ac-2836]|nr:FAD-dependent oxidoreductase [Frigoribacterium sp. VKM Ac-2836]
MGGIVLARDLAAAGLRVVLFEASDRLGGEVSRHVVAGIALDAGAESFATRGGTVAGFATELGLGDDIVLPDPRGAWLHEADGKSFPIPRTGLLGIPGDPAAADVRAVVGADGVRRALADAELPAEVGAEETTLGGLVRSRMGDAVVDRLVSPIVSGVHSLHPDLLAVDRVAPGLRSALQREGSLAGAVLGLRALAPAGSAVAGIRGGLARLVDPIVADLERHGVDVRLGTRVRSIDETGVETASGARVRARQVVLAVGDHDAVALTTRASSVPPGVITLATLVVDRPELDAAPRGTGVLVAPGSTGLRAKALTHATVKWSWLAELTGGRHVLRLSFDSPVVDRDTPDDAVRDAALADASTLLGVDLTERHLVGFGRATWDAPRRAEAVAVTGPVVEVVQAGGAVAGRGLAAIVAHSRRQAATLVATLSSPAPRD